MCAGFASKDKGAQPSSAADHKLDNAVSPFVNTTFSRRTFLRTTANLCAGGGLLPNISNSSLSALLPAQASVAGVFHTGKLAAFAMSLFSNVDVHLPNELLYMHHLGFHIKSGAPPKSLEIAALFNLKRYVRIDKLNGVSQAKIELDYLAAHEAVSEQLKHATSLLNKLLNLNNSDQSVPVFTEVENDEIKSLLVNVGEFYIQDMTPVFDEYFQLNDLNLDKNASELLLHPKAHEFCTKQLQSAITGIRSMAENLAAIDNFIKTSPYSTVAQIFRANQSAIPRTVLQRMQEVHDAYKYVPRYCSSEWVTLEKDLQPQLISTSNSAAQDQPTSASNKLHPRAAEDYKPCDGSYLLKFNYSIEIAGLKDSYECLTAPLGLLFDTYGGAAHDKSTRNTKNPQLEIYKFRIDSATGIFSFTNYTSELHQDFLQVISHAYFGRSINFGALVARKQDGIVTVYDLNSRTAIDNERYYPQRKSGSSFKNWPQPKFGFLALEHIVATDLKSLKGSDGLYTMALDKKGCLSYTKV